MKDSYQKYLVAVQNTKSFLYGQKELYKIKYVESYNDEYLQVMNDMNNAAKTVISMDLTINRQARELQKLKEKVESLEELTKEL